MPRRQRFVAAALDPILYLFGSAAAYTDLTLARFVYAPNIVSRASALVGILMETLSEGEDGRYG